MRYFAAWLVILESLELNIPFRWQLQLRSSDRRTAFPLRMSIWTKAKGQHAKHFFTRRLDWIRLSCYPISCCLGRVGCVILHPTHLRTSSGEFPITCVGCVCFSVRFFLWSDGETPRQLQLLKGVHCKLENGGTKWYQWPHNVILWIDPWLKNRQNSGEIWSSPEARVPFFHFLGPPASSFWK